MTIKLNIDTNIQNVASEYLIRYNIKHTWDNFDPTNQRVTLICYCFSLLDSMYILYLALAYDGLKINDLIQ